MISIGLAPLTSASKKLEAREPWERGGGRFQPSIWIPGKFVAEQVSSAYVPARRTINGTSHAGRGRSRTSAYNCAITYITNGTRTSVQLCKYEPVAPVAQR